MLELVCASYDEERVQSGAEAELSEASESEAKGMR